MMLDLFLKLNQLLRWVWLQPREKGKQSSADYLQNNKTNRWKAWAEAHLSEKAEPP